ncbi:hypothetical protein [Stenotrophomonas lacuserhaii]|uniref:hypothetical protein n=1 Tax=Stenotrophomonas lacuserhaii TaxID=2760084 RepID=UPI0032ECD24C
MENAIKHGIAVTPSGGQLHIAARQQDGALHINVENPRGAPRYHAGRPANCASGWRFEWELRGGAMNAGGHYLQARHCMPRVTSGDPQVKIPHAPLSLGALWYFRIHQRHGHAAVVVTRCRFPAAAPSVQPRTAAGTPAVALFSGLPRAGQLGR